MKKSIFITATNTNVGKTEATIKLIASFSKLGLKVGVFKPIETGFDKYNSDSFRLLSEVQKFNQLFLDLSIDDITPYQFSTPASPFVAKGNKSIDTNFLMDKFNFLSSLCDILLIEGAGGIMVPIKINFFMVDLIHFFNSKALLISPSNSGSINDTLLSLEALKSRGHYPFWCINLYKDKELFFDITYPFYKEYFQKIYFLNEDIDTIAALFL